jgi:hypothetical protein
MSSGSAMRWITWRPTLLLTTASGSPSDIAFADLGYLERHGVTGEALQRMAGLHTDVSEVGIVAERARVGELILSHYLPADLDAISEAEWAERAGRGFTGTTTAGRDGLRRTIQRMGPPSP